MRLVVSGKSIIATTGGRPLDPELPLLTFVHGAGGDRTIWQLVTRYFSHHGFSVLALDLPGHGSSEGPPLESISEMAEFVIDAVVAAGFESSHIVGHSMGALVALEVGGRFPESTESLALLGVSRTMPVNNDLLRAAQAGDNLATQLVTSWGLGRPSHLGGHPTPGLWMRGSISQLVEKTETNALGIDLTATNAYDQALTWAEKVTCPTLFVLGSYDLMTKPKAAGPLIDAITNASVVELETSGHHPMIEAPDATIDALAAFLQPIP